MKRILLFSMTALLLAAALAVPVSAHGTSHARGRHNTAHTACTAQGQRYADYDACPVESCTEQGLHEHDGTTYRCARHHIP